MKVIDQHLSIQKLDVMLKEWNSNNMMIKKFSNMNLNILIQQDVTQADKYLHKN